MFLFERSLDNKVEEVIKRYSDGKQCLVFCASKSGCERLSQLLSQRFQSFANPGAYSSTSSVSQIQDVKLKDLVRRGHGFHHAGIPADDRVIVEQLFTEGKIRVLCATSTLAHGVNLPAHLVIIKVLFVVLLPYSRGSHYSAGHKIFTTNEKYLYLYIHTYIHAITDYSFIYM